VFLVILKDAAYTIQYCSLYESFVGWRYPPAVLQVRHMTQATSHFCSAGQQLPPHTIIAVAAAVDERCVWCWHWQC